MKIKYFFPVIILGLTFAACSKDPKVTNQNNNTQNVDVEEEVDTNLTPQEYLSAYLVEDILEADADQEEELRLYIENEIFPLVSKSKKVTAEKLSSSQYLIIYDDNGVSKNIALQKFYNPIENKIVFERLQTGNGAGDNK